VGASSARRATSQRRARPPSGPGGDGTCRIQPALESTFAARCIDARMRVHLFRSVRLHLALPRPLISSSSPSSSPSASPSPPPHARSSLFASLCASALAHATSSPLRADKAMSAAAHPDARPTPAPAPTSAYVNLSKQAKYVALGGAGVCEFSRVASLCLAFFCAMRRGQLGSMERG
jgi:hypothetical protein